MKKLKIIILLVLLFPFFGNSQQYEQSSLYMHNTLYYNPAYAGVRNALSASIVARKQWVGYEGSPSSQFVSVHTPLLNQKLGVGVHFDNDKIGARKKTSAFIDVSTTIKISQKNDRVNFGLSAGIDNFNFNFSEIYAIDYGDMIANQKYSSLKPNIGAGVYFHNDKYYIGLSVPTILEANNEFFGYSLNMNKRHYFLAAGYVFKLNSVLDLKPSTLIRYTYGAPLSYELNASLFMYKKLWIGAMYRGGEGFGINASITLFNSLTIGYAYDMPTNELRTHQSGSHEVLILYDFSLFNNKNKIYSPRYF